MVPHTVIDESGIVKATQLAMNRAIYQLPSLPTFLLVDALAYLR